MLQENDSRLQKQIKNNVEKDIKVSAFFAISLFVAMPTTCSMHHYC
jgi:hypothetical protein